MSVVIGMPLDGDTDGGCSSHKDGCDGTTGMGHADPHIIFFSVFG